MLRRPPGIHTIYAAADNARSDSLKDDPAVVSPREVRMSSLGSQASMRFPFRNGTSFSMSGITSKYPRPPSAGSSPSSASCWTRRSDNERHRARSLAGMVAVTLTAKVQSVCVYVPHTRTVGMVDPGLDTRCKSPPEGAACGGGQIAIVEEPT